MRTEGRDSAQGPQDTGFESGLHCLGRSSFSRAASVSLPGNGDSNSTSQGCREIKGMRSGDDGDGALQVGEGKNPQLM